MSSNFGTPLNPISIPGDPVITASINAFSTYTLGYGAIGSTVFIVGSGNGTLVLPKVASTYKGYGSFTSVLNTTMYPTTINAYSGDTILKGYTSVTTFVLPAGEWVRLFNKGGTQWVADTFFSKVNASGGTMTGQLYLPAMDPSWYDDNAASTRYVKDLLTVRAYAPLSSPSFTGTPVTPTPTPLSRSGQVANDISLTYTAPPGMIGMFAMGFAPTGWLKANGAVVPISSYQDLATNIYVGDAYNSDLNQTYGYKCTSSDGLTRSTSGTYIKIPDFRGEFPRFLDDGKGVDTGSGTTRPLREYQAFQLANHGHGLQLAVQGGSNSGPRDVLASSDRGGNTPNVFMNLQSVVVNGGTHNNSESRPRNVALLACIKY